jgi:glycosyltransferase involved in cell wall biosynthesis
MNRNIFLTIAIPTLNGSATIGATLESILEQIDLKGHRIEIVIGDNGSDIALQLENKFVQYEKSGEIRVIHFATNLGYDLNLARLLEYCDGEYVWLLGDDDMVVRSLIPSVLEILVDERPRCLILESSKVSEFEENQFKVELFSSPKEFFEENVLNSASISHNIFNLSNMQIPPPNVIGLNWLHVAILAEMCVQSENFKGIRLSGDVITIGNNPIRWKKHFSSPIATGYSFVVVLLRYQSLLSRNRLFALYKGRRQPMRSLPGLKVFYLELLKLSHSRFYFIYKIFLLELSQFYKSSLDYSNNPFWKAR